MAELKVMEKSWEIQYGYSLYWAITTMISVGYGDITPRNYQEILFTVVCMLVSCIVFAYSINSIWDILQSVKEGELRFQRHLNAINRFMRDKKINPKLQLRVRAYLEYYWAAKSREKELEDIVLNSLAPSIREELIFQANGFFFKYIPWMSYFSKEFLVQLSFLVEEIKGSPNEIIFSEKEQEDDDGLDHSFFYISVGRYQIYHPLAIYNNGKGYILKELQEGQSFGQFSFFTGERREENVKSLDYGTCYKLSRKDFLSCLENFPTDYETYCFIKDQIIFNENNAIIDLECYICQDPSHFAYNCPKNHYIPDRVNLVKKNILENNQIQEDRKFVFRRVYSPQYLLLNSDIQDEEMRQKNRFSAIVNQQIVQEQAIRLQKELYGNKDEHDETQSQLKSNEEEESESNYSYVNFLNNFFRSFILCFIIQIKFHIISIKQQF